MTRYGRLASKGANCMKAWAALGVVVCMACGSAKEDPPPEPLCRTAYHCVTQADGSYACDAGYEWQTPNDPATSGYSCVWVTVQPPPPPPKNPPPNPPPPTCDTACECGQAIYTVNTCASSDPCHWVGDGYCDSACSNYASPALNDAVDCPVRKYLTIKASVSCSYPVSSHAFTLNLTDGYGTQVLSGDGTALYTYNTDRPPLTVEFDAYQLGNFNRGCAYAGGTHINTVGIYDGTTLLAGCVAPASCATATLDW